MELIAIIGSVIGLVAMLGLASDDDRGGVKFFGVFILLCQLCWFPLFCDKVTEIDTCISNRHANYTFEAPVKITKIHTYKYLSVFVNEIKYEVTFIRGD